MYMNISRGRACIEHCASGEDGKTSSMTQVDFGGVIWGFFCFLFFKRGVGFFLVVVVLFCISSFFFFFFSSFFFALLMIFFFLGV